MNSALSFAAIGFYLRNCSILRIPEDADDYVICMNIFYCLLNGTPLTESQNVFMTALKTEFSNFLGDEGLLDFLEV